MARERHKKKQILIIVRPFSDGSLWYRHWQTLGSHSKDDHWLRMCSYRLASVVCLENMRLVVRFDLYWSIYYFAMLTLQFEACKHFNWNWMRPYCGTWQQLEADRYRRPLCASWIFHIMGKNVYGVHCSNRRWVSGGFKVGSKMESRFAFVRSKQAEAWAKTEYNDHKCSISGSHGISYFFRLTSFFFRRLPPFAFLHSVAFPHSVAMINNANMLLVFFAFNSSYSSSPLHFLLG